MVEYSNDLRLWTEIAIPAESENGVIVTQGVSSDGISVTIPATVGMPTFARLKVSE